MSVIAIAGCLPRDLRRRTLKRDIEGPIARVRVGAVLCPTVVFTLLMAPTSWITSIA